MLIYKIMISNNFKIIKSSEIVKRWNYKIMLNYTLSRMCMNNIKNNIKYTNTLCRGPLYISF